MSQGTWCDQLLYHWRSLLCTAGGKLSPQIGSLWPLNTRLMLGQDVSRSDFLNTSIKGLNIWAIRCLSVSFRGTRRLILLHFRQNHARFKPTYLLWAKLTGCSLWPQIDHTYVWVVQSLSSNFEIKSQVQYFPKLCTIPLIASVPWLLNEGQGQKSKAVYGWKVQLAYLRQKLLGRVLAEAMQEEMHTLRSEMLRRIEWKRLWEPWSLLRINRDSCHTNAHTQWCNSSNVHAMRYNKWDCSPEECHSSCLFFVTIHTLVCTPQC